MMARKAGRGARGATMGTRLGRLSVALLLQSAFVPALAGAQDGQVADTAAAGTPASPVELDFPVEVRKATLASVLVVPGGSGPFPAVVLVSGSGDVTFTPEHPLVRTLAEDGVAVLVLGKRGVGASTGDWRRESLERRALDVARALETLRARPEIDPDRVGLVGHSQGGWVVQIAAASDPGIPFVVMLAGPGQSVRDQVLTDERIHMERRGVPPEEVERRLRSLGRQLRVLAAVAPVCRATRAHYLCHVIRFDPTEVLEEIRSPVLALFGELDPEVPPDPNVALVSEALERAGNPDVTIHVFPRANHQFWLAETGLRDEYMEMEQVFAPGFLDMVSAWIRERARGDAAHRP